MTLSGGTSGGFGAAGSSATGTNVPNANKNQGGNKKFKGRIGNLAVSEIGTKLFDFADLEAALESGFSRTSIEDYIKDNLYSFEGFDSNVKSEFGIGEDDGIDYTDIGDDTYNYNQAGGFGNMDIAKLTEMGVSADRIKGLAENAGARGSSLNLDAAKKLGLQAGGAPDASTYDYAARGDEDFDMSDIEYLMDTYNYTNENFKKIADRVKEGGGNVTKDAREKLGLGETYDKSFRDFQSSYNNSFGSGGTESSEALTGLKKPSVSEYASSKYTPNLFDYNFASQGGEGYSLDDANYLRTNFGASDDDLKSLADYYVTQKDGSVGAGLREALGLSGAYDKATRDAAFGTTTATPGGLTLPETTDGAAESAAAPTNTVQSVAPGTAGTSKFMTASGGAQGAAVESTSRMAGQAIKDYNFGSEITGADISNLRAQGASDKQLQNVVTRANRGEERIDTKAGVFKALGMQQPAGQFDTGKKFNAKDVTKATEAGYTQNQILKMANAAGQAGKSVDANVKSVLKGDEKAFNKAVKSGNYGSTQAGPTGQSGGGAQSGSFNQNQGIQGTTRFAGATTTAPGVSAPKSQTKAKTETKQQTMSNKQMESFKTGTVFDKNDRQKAREQGASNSQIRQLSKAHDQKMEKVDDRRAKQEAAAAAQKKADNQAKRQAEAKAQQAAADKAARQKAKAQADRKAAQQAAKAEAERKAAAQARQAAARQKAAAAAKAKAQAAKKKAAADKAAAAKAKAASDARKAARAKEEAARKAAAKKRKNNRKKR